MEEQTKQKIVRGVLLSSAIVIGIVAVYTTILLFSSPDLSFHLSPPAPNISNETDSENGVSFNINVTASDDFEKSENKTNKTYESGIIPPHDPSVPPKPGPISLLIILDDLETSQGFALLITIILEIIVIYQVHRKAKIKFIGSNN